VTDKQVGKIGRCLGKLRDLDVLLEALQTRYYPNLPKKEQRILEQVLQELVKKRDKTVKRVQKTIDSKSYKTLKKKPTPVVRISPIYFN
jgi:CHAD domain-containing protein